jgi:RNA polymerase sigma-70 factor (ECF subfamily)
MTKSASLDQSLVVPSRDQPEETAADLRALFTSHASYVWSTLRRLGVAPSDVEDLTHEVFVRVHAHLGEHDGSRPVRPWLFGFAFRVASEHRRRAHRRYEDRDTDRAEAAADPGPLADERLAAEQNRRLVLEALQAIDLDRRAVFVLYEIDGVAMSEIARSLDVPVNTAYSRLRAARGEFATAVKRLKRGQR